MVQCTSEVATRAMHAHPLDARSVTRALPGPDQVVAKVCSTSFLSNEIRLRRSVKVLGSPRPS